MQAEPDIREQVRSFYDTVGWTEVGDGLYQNARYEDLRPVSRQYIQRCHRRVARCLPAAGDYLLDAGSGPIQYPEYLEFSAGHRFRVCLDLSIRALAEARRRLGSGGLYVVGDLSKLPFRTGVFSGVVSMHAVHHLPPDQQLTAFNEFERALRSGGKAAVVYSWGHPLLMRLAQLPIAAANAVIRLYRRTRSIDAGTARSGRASSAPVGTYTFKHDYRWVRSHLSHLPELEVRVWRSVSTGFLRALIHRRLLGRLWLRLLYNAEELVPRFFGKTGQYPLISFEKR